MERPQFTPGQRAFLVTEAARTQHVTQVVRAFRHRFPHARTPSRSTVYRNLRKYQETGTSVNCNAGRSGRPRTARTAENIAAVQETLQQPQPQGDQRVSSRRNGLGLSQSAFNRITRQDLRLYPYQMIRRHELFPADHARRLAFCNWFLERPPRFLESLVIGDEACFCMNSSLSTHNILQYAPRGEKPVDFSYEKKDCRQKLTVWIGMIGDGTLLGPFFFQQNINGERYLQMINDQIVPVLDERERFRRQQNGRFRHLWWAQDGAPPHRSRVVMARLQELFGDRIVALNQPVEWPPRSPDLTPLDFFVWGYLKTKVFQSPPANLIELQERITRETNDLREDRQLLRRVFRGMLHRAEKCLERLGGHVED